MVSSVFLIALLLASVISVATVAYAQVGMTQTTSKGTLDISVEPTWNENANASFKVSFLNPGTDTLHQHQDYDFRILKNGNEVFSAAKQSGQSLIHNAEGTITVPYLFQEQGEYKIQIYLAGTGISPTIPTDEEVLFPIQVTPEFPTVAVGALAALMTTAILLGRRRMI